MGGLCPNRHFRTLGLSKQDITDVLEQTETTKHKTDIASEVKVAMLSLHYCKEIIHPCACVAARPQSNNEFSEFTKDVCKSAQRLEK